MVAVFLKLVNLSISANWLVLAVLAARAALRSGAGLVFLGVPERIYPIVAAGLEEPVAFGAFQDGRLIGYVEGSPEMWNGRFRISNICLFDSGERRRGVGTMLMAVIQKEAAASGARMIVLETQSCNEAAIGFYRKNGFAVIGFDLYAYSNTDPERHEVRVEMGKKLQQSEQEVRI
mgnify:CR=1 FL=1